MKKEYLKYLNDIYNYYNANDSQINFDYEFEKLIKLFKSKNNRRALQILEYIFNLYNCTYKKQLRYYFDTLKSIINRYKFS